jgi:hypothetical protein
MMELEEEWQAVAPLPQLAESGVPWEDPGLSGVVGFYRTLRDVLWRPGEFFENLGEGGWAEPLAFALVVSTASMSGSLFWHLLILAGGGSSGEAGLGTSLNLGSTFLMGLMVAAPVLVLIDLGIGGLCWWGSVAMLGTTGGFTPAWRIYGYAHAGLALALIPLFGPLLAAFWVLALLYVGAQKRFGFSGWESLEALAIFLALQAGVGLFLVLGLIATLVGLGFLALLG